MYSDLLLIDKIQIKVESEEELSQYQASRTGMAVRVSQSEELYKGPRAAS